MPETHGTPDSTSIRLPAVDAEIAEIVEAMEHPDPTEPTEPTEPIESVEPTHPLPPISGPPSGRPAQPPVRFFQTVEDVLDEANDNGLGVRPWARNEAARVVRDAEVEMGRINHAFKTGLISIAEWYRQHCRVNREWTERFVENGRELELAWVGETS